MREGFNSRGDDVFLPLNACRHLDVDRQNTEAIKNDERWGDQSHPSCLQSSARKLNQAVQHNKTFVGKEKGNESAPYAHPMDLGAEKFVRG
jgi:hypothetical protein